MFQEQGDRAVGLEVWLMKNLDRVENILIQHSLYTSSTIWVFANYVKNVGAKMGYTIQMDFPPFHFMDPDSVYGQPPAQCISD